LFSRREVKGCSLLCSRNFPHMADTALGGLSHGALAVCGARGVAAYPLPLILPRPSRLKTIWARPERTSGLIIARTVCGCRENRDEARTVRAEEVEHRELPPWQAGDVCFDEQKTGAPVRWCSSQIESFAGALPFSCFWIAGLYALDIAKRLKPLHRWQKQVRPEAVLLLQLQGSRSPIVAMAGSPGKQKQVREVEPDIVQDGIGKPLDFRRALFGVWLLVCRPNFASQGCSTLSTHLQS